MRHYAFVGPPEILSRLKLGSRGWAIRSQSDLQDWVVATGQTPGPGGLVIATYIVDSAELLLRVADQRSEHVACAGGASVLAAGEIGFGGSMGRYVVEEVSNLSTGYCPEASCWPAVENALNGIGVTHPEGFTSAYEFRRCEKCRQVNVVKEGEFTCGCGWPLPPDWNLDD